MRLLPYDPGIATAMDFIETALDLLVCELVLPTERFGESAPKLVSELSSFRRVKLLSEGEHLLHPFGSHDPILIASPAPVESNPPAVDIGFGCAHSLR